MNYPGTFNGAWALSPDPVDFHDFFGPDITKRGQNFYRDAAGNLYGICREHGHDRTTIEQFVESPYGCGWRGENRSSTQKPWAQRQMDTYDDVFSPSLPSGKPAPLLNRTTGAIDPDVAAYWESHYDITHLLQERWSVLGSAALRKASRLRRHRRTRSISRVPLRSCAMRCSDLGSDAEFGFAPGADHWQVYDYHGNLITYALSEMVKRLNP